MFCAFYLFFLCSCGSAYDLYNVIENESRRNKSSVNDNSNNDESSNYDYSNENEIEYNTEKITDYTIDTIDVNPKYKYQVGSYEQYWNKSQEQINHLPEKLYGMAYEEAVTYKVLNDTASKIDYEFNDEWDWPLFVEEGDLYYPLSSCRYTMINNYGEIKIDEKAVILPDSVIETHVQSCRNGDKIVFLAI